MPNCDFCFIDEKISDRKRIFPAFKCISAPNEAVTKNLVAVKGPQVAVV